jgi:hypothetical protein
MNEGPGEPGPSSLVTFYELTATIVEPISLLLSR